MCKGDNLELPKSLQCFVDWEFFLAYFLIPVEPHEAVAEVSKLENL